MKIILKLVTVVIFISLIGINLSITKIGIGENIKLSLFKNKAIADDEGCLDEGQGASTWKQDSSIRCTRAGCVNVYDRTCKDGGDGCSPLTCN